jgi:AraC family transcriptional regulator, carnitine catabolism transcriptional activator
MAHPHLEVHFLLLPEFSMLGFMCAVEPLRIANHFREGSYRWRVLTANGEPVLATNGLVLQSSGSFVDVDKASLVFVLSGFNTHLYYREAMGEWLRRMRDQGAVIGGIDGGPFVLAEANLIGKDRVALHWDSHAPFATRYPAVRLTNSLFEIQPNTVTCAGGTASIDMMLSLIRHQHGLKLATEISDWIILGRIRNTTDPQRLEIAPRYGAHNEKVGETIRLMLANISSPIGLAELSAGVGVTPRQLQRLFATHLKVSPAVFYQRLRLEKARELLQQTTLNTTAVAVACGFSSVSHFSRSYKCLFQVSPTSDRIEDAGNRKSNFSAVRGLNRDNKRSTSKVLKVHSEDPPVPLRHTKSGT